MNQRSETGQGLAKQVSKYGRIVPNPSASSKSSKAQGASEGVGGRQTEEITDTLVDAGQGLSSGASGMYVEDEDQIGLQEAVHAHSSGGQPEHAPEDQQNEQDGGSLGIVANIGAGCGERAPDEQAQIKESAATPEFVGPDEASELLGQHPTRKQQFVGHASPGNRYNIGSQEEERVSLQTHLNNFMASPDGTEVLDQAAEFREAKQPMQKIANQKHGHGASSNLSSHALEGGHIQQQEGLRQAPPQKPEMNIKMISCASKDHAGGPSVDARQEREVKHGSRDMQIAPDEPSELLVRPVEKLADHDMIAAAERSSLEQADNQESTHRKTLAVAHLPSSPRSKSRSKSSGRGPGSPDSALSPGEYDINLAVKQGEVLQFGQQAVDEDADAVEVETAAEGDDQREAEMLPAASESQPPGPGRIRRQGESSRVPENGLSVPDEMEELAEHTRADEDGQRMVPAEDPQISPRIRNEESKEEDFRARNIEAAESYAGRFGQTQQSNQATAGANNRQSRHYPSFASATPLRPNPRHHGAPASSSTSPSMNYNFRSSPYLSQTLRSPHQNLGGGANGGVGASLGGVGASNPQFAAPGHYQSLFNFGNRYENNRSSNSNSNGLIGDAMRVSSLSRANPPGRAGPRQGADRTMTSAGRTAAARNAQPSMTESSPDAMSYPRSVRMPQQNHGPGGVQDALIEANALGELEAEYELRLNNQRQGGRGQAQQFNMEQQAVNMNEYNSEIKAKSAPTAEDRSINVVDHSSNVSDDFARFLFNESLADLRIVVRKGPSAFDMNFNQILSKQSAKETKKGSESSQTSGKNSKESADNGKSLLVKIPCHKFVLSARCQYFFAQFCKSEWSDKNQNEACFTQFSEEPMREFLKYLYTGKLQIDTIKIMGILRISSFFGMEKLVETCKIQLTDPNILNAYDLSLLYCEVRDCSQDFDDMKAFLTSLIPKRVENHMICSILKEIWVQPNTVHQQHESSSVDRVDNSRSTEEVIQGSEHHQRPTTQDTDLQDILVQRIQTTLNEVLDDPMICEDLFKLPKEAMQLIVSSSETCINELKLFKAILSKIQNDEQANEDAKQTRFLRDLAKNYVRLSQLDVKKLVTDIKFCKIFDDDLIFKAIQYNVARDVIDEDTLNNDLRFVPRGLYTFFDFKHFDLDIQVLNDHKEIVPSHHNCYLKIKRDKICQSTDEACLSAIMSEPLPLHGIHYWEFKVKAHDPKKISQERSSYEEQRKSGGNEKSRGSNGHSDENDDSNNPGPNGQSMNQDARQMQQSSHHLGPGTSINISEGNPRPTKPRQLFVGLCQVNENHSMEDTHQAQNSVMLNLLDSNFWCNGQQIQNFQSKNIKIKNPFEVEKKNQRNAARGQQELVSRGRPRDSEEMIYSSSQGRNTRAQLEHVKFEEQESDIVRVAVDLRYASNFQSFWNENQDVEEEEAELPLPEPQNLFGSNNLSVPRPGPRGGNIGAGGGRMQFGQNRQRNQIGVVGHGRGNSTQNRFANQGTYRSILGQRALGGVNHPQGASRPAGMASFNQSYVNLQRRIQESMRDVRNAQSRHHQNLHHHNLNLFLNLNNAGGNGGGADNAYPSRLNNFSGLASELSMMLFSQSPSLCKIHYAVNDSEWSEGIDLNLANLKKAPLNLVVSMPPEMDYQPELLMSRAAYFAQWEMVPKDCLFFRKQRDAQSKAEAPEEME